MMLFLSIVVMFLGLNFKLSYQSNLISNIEWIIIYNVGAFLVLKILLASCFFYIVIISEINRNYRLSQLSIRNQLFGPKCIFQLMIFCLCVLACGHLTIIWLMNISPFFHRVIEVLAFEIMFAGIVLCLVIIAKLLTLIAKGVISLWGIYSRYKKGYTGFMF
mgnify:CR=1 FL=1